MAAADRAYEYAKNRILDGRFPGGELIAEGDVAEPTGLSRTPVREAFLRLEAEGLLQLYPKRGALVVPVSPLEVESVMETRRLIESFAIERVIEHGTPVGQELTDAIERGERCAEASERQGFVDADREFHRVFMAAAGNPLLLDLHDSLRDRQSRMGLVAIARVTGRMETILGEHRTLRDAVVAARPVRATEILAEHLDGTLQALRDSLVVGTPPRRDPSPRPDRGERRTALRQE